MWTLYWIMKLDTIGTFFGITSFISFVLFAIGIGIFIDFGVIQDKKLVRTLCKVFVPMLSLYLIVSILLGVLLPSTKQMSALIVIPPTINYAKDSEVLKKMPDKILNLADKWMEELEPKKQ